MFVERLELHDFRNYRRTAVDLPAGVALFVGDNAQGKTNLLEAVHYLAVGGSHRTSSEAALVRAGTDAAVLRVAARSDDGRQLRIEAELRPGDRNRIRVNGQPQPRFRDGLGQVRSVLFAPEDLGLVRGDPADRRRFLDELLTLRRPAYSAARQDYERVLRQRNALLRDRRARGPAADDTLLDTWTDALVTTGATLLSARIAVVHALAGPVTDAYADLVAGGTGAAAPGPVLEYHLSTGRAVPAVPGRGVPDPAAVAEELRAGLADRAAQEQQRGVTLAGPHRDELFLGIGALPAKGFASHGEQWTLALALRLASRDVLAQVGDVPVVLLDDVFAELDEGRRARLAARCASFGQVLVTTAVAADVPLAGPRYDVRAGTVTPPRAPASPERTAPPDGTAPGG